MNPRRTPRRPIGYTTSSAGRTTSRGNVGEWSRPPRHPHAERLGKWAATVIVGGLIAVIAAAIVAVIIWLFRFALA